MINFKTYESKREPEQETAEDTAIETDAATFREMVERLRFTEPSTDPIPADGRGVLYTEYNSNDGTREYYERGITRDRTTAPSDDRAARYMRRAYLYTHPNARR